MPSLSEAWTYSSALKMKVGEGEGRKGEKERRERGKEEEERRKLSSLVCTQGLCFTCNVSTPGSSRSPPPPSVKDQATTPEHLPTSHLSTQEVSFRATETFPSHSVLAGACLRLPIVLCSWLGLASE